MHFLNLTCDKGTFIDLLKKAGQPPDIIGILGHDNY